MIINVKKNVSIFTVAILTDSQASPVVIYQLISAGKKTYHFQVLIKKRQRKDFRDF